MVSYFQINICELCPSNMLPDVVARKLAQKYVAINLSIVLNIASFKDVIINERHWDVYSTKYKFLWENWELLKWIFSYNVLSTLMLLWRKSCQLSYQIG